MATIKALALSDGTEIELRLLRRTAVRVPRQNGLDWLFEAIQAVVVRPAWIAKAELGIGEIIDRIARARSHGEG